MSQARIGQENMLLAYQPEPQNWHRHLVKWQLLRPPHSPFELTPAAPSQVKAGQPCKGQAVSELLLEICWLCLPATQDQGPEKKNSSFSQV